MAQLSKLRNISVGLFCSCLGAYYLFQYSVSKALINSPFCKNAMEMLSKHNGAIGFLGEPITAGSAKFCENRNSSAKATVQIFVAGPKSKGQLFVTINETGEDQVDISSVQLQIGNDKSKRLEIKGLEEPSRSQSLDVSS